MFNPLMMLAVEASGVIALRMMKMMRGGRTARREANLMVSEKIKAAIEAIASLAAGASGDDVVHRYRQHVKRKMLSGFRAEAETACLSKHDGSVNRFRLPPYSDRRSTAKAV